ncbi:hypothetical protein ANOM_004028 [Aspergillus nomiae NRRL 13137]|uniref:ASST-domain-containing protein n=1 Tax=Aspergillus nomiae NRRL (strain ATCC 15546 / NRRL 13137 / CBS 260.88 / M93) TaxID=1509407 RepID=A0A0L1J6L1_ASPN3|nr:uncharacterized protein ANOM_004028 [Aspergillus nomiae NRRL 13137]KNG87387.1 hypothetical protein ANOM_004028 [Aspergillus nomiae NRRL 13137]
MQLLHLAITLASIPWYAFGQMEIPKDLPGDGPVLNSQEVYPNNFIGKSALAHPLSPKFRLTPDMISFHQDGGNTRTQDWPAPLGLRPQNYSRAMGVQSLYLGGDGTVLTRMTCNGTTPSFCMAVLDPQSLDPLAFWAPQNQTLVSPYGAFLENRFIISTAERFLYEVEIKLEGKQVSFHEARVVDLTSVTSGLIVSVMYDGDRNLWFISNSFSAGSEQPVGATIGFVTPNGAIGKMDVHGEVVENSLAINGKTAYVLTGPAGPSTNTMSAMGYMYAAEADLDNLSVTVVWKEAYDAGSSVKPGGLARGSGSSPVLLGDQFVGFTDNADSQVNLNIFRQADAFRQNGTSFVCKVPLFEPGASSNENAMVGYFDGDSTYSVVINNNYGNPGMQDPGTDDINGVWNSLASLAPGLDRVDISKIGECSVRWKSSFVSTSGTQFSTKTGLLYGYTQDKKLAEQGEYVWYYTAVDFDTGDVVWEQLAGVGGVYNNNFQHVLVSPSGAIYVPVMGGVAWMKDE